MQHLGIITLSVDNGTVFNHILKRFELAVVPLLLEWSWMSLLLKVLLTSRSWRRCDELSNRMCEIESDGQENNYSELQLQPGECSHWTDGGLKCSVTIALTTFPISRVVDHYFPS